MNSIYAVLKLFAVCVCVNPYLYNIILLFYIRNVLCQMENEKERDVLVGKKQPCSSFIQQTEVVGSK